MTAANDLTARLIDHARTLSPDLIASDAMLVAKTCILDWLGCALAGTHEPLVSILVDEARDEGASPRASVIGRDMRTSTQWSALLNGCASHALDYDDTLFVGREHPIHPTAPVLAAVLALAEERHASGSELLTAFVAGVETECRLGAAIGVEHYSAGWHSTSTIGAFGAAAACAHLLKLDQGKWCHAFGIAGTLASGLKSAFGSMSKPFQVGKAAVNGLTGARLALRGFTGNPAVIETSQGFAATHHGDPRVDALDEATGRFLIENTVFKYHASCYLTHSAIEATLRLMEEIKVTPERVGAVEVHVPAQHLSVCNIHEPTTGLEGKFSLRVTVALALLGDDTAAPSTYTDERMRASDLVQMRDRVTVHSSDEVSGTETIVAVRLVNGTTVSKTVDVGVPASDLKGQWESISSKFERLAASNVDGPAVKSIREMVRDLEGVADVGELLAFCRPAV